MKVHQIYSHTDPLTQNLCYILLSLNMFVTFDAYGEPVAYGKGALQQQNIW